MKAQALAVVFGAAAGVGLALVRKADDPPPLAPAAARPLATPTVSAAPPATPASGAPAADLVAVADNVPPPPSAAAAPSGSAGLVLKPPAPLPPITTPDELTAAEIKCYQKEPEACRRAADAYEAGRMVPRDAERARNYRKVELTQLVRNCERDSPNACLVLGERYQSGDGVARSTRQAAALVDRARTLCRRKVNPTECAALNLAP
jgi:TPR repeat protein